MFDLPVHGGDIEAYEKNAKTLTLYRKKRTFRVALSGLRMSALCRLKQCEKRRLIRFRLNWSKPRLPDSKLLLLAEVSTPEVPCIFVRPRLISGEKKGLCTHLS